MADHGCEPAGLHGGEDGFWLIERQDQVSSVMDEIGRAIACPECPEAQAAELTLAAAEAVANALKHGGLQPEGKSIRVWFKRSGSEVELCILDQGPGFDPEALPDPTAEDRLRLLARGEQAPGGWGLHLIRRTADRVTWNESGNFICIYKKFQPECG